MTDEVAPLIVNKGELARMLRVSAPTIDTMIAEGCPVSAGGSNGVPYQFDFYQVKTWREERDAKRNLEEQARQQRINAAQSELFGGQQLAPQGIGDIRETLEAERLAIIVSKQKGELIARDDVRNDYAAMFGVVRQHVLGWATSLGRLAGLTPDQQKEADRLARSMLVAMHGQIKDSALRPPMTDDAL